jgi:hypothetical protein
MSYDSARIALYTELKTNLPSTIGLRFDTIKETDPIVNSRKSWVRCMIEPIETSQHSIGMSKPLDRTVGLLNIEIYDLEENGYAGILRIADTIKSIYYGKSFLNGDLVINSVMMLNKETYSGWNIRVLQVRYVQNEKRV